MATREGKGVQADRDTAARQVQHWSKVLMMAMMTIFLVPVSDYDGTLLEDQSVAQPG